MMCVFDSRDYGDFFNMGEYSRLGINTEKRRIKIFDTTLRDGEQSPGVYFNENTKTNIALKLYDLGVDMIEAGFPAVSDEEFETIKGLNNIIDNVCSLSRCNINDINKVIDSNSNTIHLFIATSDIHMEYKLKMTREEVSKRIIDSIDYAKDHGLKVIFSPEDATRTDINFLREIISGINNKVETINIPDTIGIMNPISMYYFIKKIREFTKNNISVHCHNDFGLATANTLSGLIAGADEVQVTVNGIGERSGNAALEEVVSSVYGFLNSYTGIKMEKLYEISKYISSESNITPQKNKAIIGENAFAHEAGIHVQGIINNSRTYEAINPELFNIKRKIVIGKHSGKAAIKYILENNGINKTDDEINDILNKIKMYNKSINEDFLLEVSKNE